MNRVRLYQFHDRHPLYSGRLYFPDHLLHLLGDSLPRELDESLLHDGAEFRTWCWERRIPIHGMKHEKVPSLCERIELDDQQRFEFKMRWGF